MHIRYAIAGSVTCMYLHGIEQCTLMCQVNTMQGRHGCSQVYSDEVRDIRYLVYTVRRIRRDVDHNRKGRRAQRQRHI
jgi:hypothetical protein